MKKNFKKIHQDLTPPEESKQLIMDEIRTYTMLSDIFELFTGDFARANLRLLIPEAAKQKKEKKKD